MSEGERSNGLPGPRRARRADDFDAMYVAGRSPWAIGRPQSAFRPKFVDALRASMPVGAGNYMLCFSDLEPGDWGPRRIQQDEIRVTFSDGWCVEDIASAKIEITVEPGSARAWLASILRIFGGSIWVEPPSRWWTTADTWTVECATTAPSGFPVSAVGMFATIVPISGDRRSASRYSG
jgi:hypothetical protein